MKLLLLFVAELFGKVPERIRGWLYVAVIVACLLFVAVTAWRNGLSVDQLVALFGALASALATANRPTVRTRVDARRARRTTTNQED